VAIAERGVLGDRGQVRRALCEEARSRSGDLLLLLTDAHRAPLRSGCALLLDLVFMLERYRSGKWHGRAGRIDRRS